MGVMKTHEEFIEKVSPILPNITFLEKYTGTKNKIHTICNVCGYQWYPIPSNLYKGHGCPNCTKHGKISHDEFVKKMADVNPNLTILGEYVNHHSIILYKCNKCEQEHSARAGNLLEGHGCPYCFGRYRIKGKNDLASVRPDLVKYFLNPNICNSISVHSQKKVDLKCDICGKTVTMVVDKFTARGFHCPCCNGSKGENKISLFLSAQEITYVEQKRFQSLRGIGGRPLSFDFYLPEYKLLIEYQGKQHYSPVDLFGGEEQFKIQKEHDKQKRFFAEINNYHLLEIPFWEYNNVDSIILSELERLRILQNKEVS